jgi:hypothetical protein
MKDTTATFRDVTRLDGRRPGRSRRAMRFVVAGVGVGLAAVAALGTLVATGTLAAAWIVGNAVATHPVLKPKTLSGPAAIALTDRFPAVASAEDFTGSVPGATAVAATVPARIDAADAPTFAAKWFGTTAAASAPAATSTDTVLVVTQSIEPARAVAVAKPIEPARVVASLQPAALVAPPVAPPVAAAAAAPEKRFTPVPSQAHNKPAPQPESDGHTAVYDIAAHTVYLPNGTKLEAHSGLGEKLDDPRYVNLKNTGPTPPNVYDLVLREQLFHTVRALRLNPVGGDSMFGRDGILAHSYMLGANGQSNGCVSFKDYPAFLHAYLNGEIDRLVVVAHLGNTSWRTASAGRGPAGRYPDNNP